MSAVQRRAKNHPSMQITLVTTVLGAFLVAGCVLMGVYTFTFRTVLDTQQTDAETRLASSLAEQAGMALLWNDAQKFQAWTYLTAQASRAIVVALIDRDGELLAAAPSRQAYEAFAPHAHLGETTRYRLEGVSAGRTGGMYWISSRPVVHSAESHALGSILVVSPVPSDSLLSLGKAHFLAVGSLLVMAGLTSAMLFKRIVRPIRELADLSGHCLEQDLQKLTATSEEAAKIRQLFHGLIQDVGNWREEADELRLTVDTRVAAKTRSINTAYQRAEKQSYTDALTKCANRRLLEDRIESVVDSHRNQGKDLSVVMIDVDNFKTLNDTFGHQAGDDLLVFVGELLRTSIRADDMAVRYGGDEFVLVLMNTSTEAATKVVSRILALFKQQAPLFQLEPELSLSAGIASLGDHRHASGAELLEMADRALYSAKKSGKAGFVTATPENGDVASFDAAGREC